MPLHGVRFFFAATLFSLLAADIRPEDPRTDSDPHTKTEFVPRTFASAPAWKLQREKIRRQVLTSAGLWPMPKRGTVRVHPHGEIPRQGYIVEKLFLETLPGFRLGVNVYRPATGAGKHPAVLVPHGHWKNGRIEHSGEYSVPALCALLAANGYVALAYDMVGYNDTRQVPHKFGDSDEERGWSYGPLGLQLWNSIRALDYLVSRPDVDVRRLAITGASGGGTQTYLLAAVDDRIKVSIPAVMVSSKFQGDDPCEMAPGLRIGTNNVEIAAVMAPKPMLLLSSTKDWTSEVPTVAYPAIREIYRLMGAPGNVESHQVDAEHGYNAEQRRVALRFLGKHLRMRADIPEPSDIKDEPEEFLIGPTKQDADGVFATWRQMMTDRNATMSAGQRAALLRELTGGHWPGRIVYSANGEDVFLRRQGENHLVAARVLPGKSARPILAIHSDGKSAAAKMEVVKRATESGAQVLLIDLFNPPPTFWRRGDFLVFHHAVDANRVQDILTGAAWLRGQGARSVQLVCGEGTAELCRLAAAVSRIPLSIAADGQSSKNLEIPGLRAAGF